MVDYTAPVWVDVPEGTIPPDGAPAIDAAHLQALSDAVAALAASTPSSHRLINLQDDPDVVVAGVWTWTQATGAPFGGSIGNTGSPAINDGALWLIALDAGTYKLSLYGLRGPDSATATIDISHDGTTWTAVGSLDMYAASAAAVRSVMTGIVIPAAGLYRLRFRALAKNASSSNYAMRLAAVSWAKTS